MAITRQLAENYYAQISVSGVFVTISGLNSIMLSEEKEEVDVTGFDSGGWRQRLYGTRDGTLTLEGFRLTDPDTGARDPGQKAVEKAARQDGSASRRTYRLAWKPQYQTNYIEFNGFAQNGGFGGGMNEGEPWSTTIVFDGAPVAISGMHFNPDL